MGFFKAMDISTSALTAQSFRMDVISQNVANADTTRTADGTPYQRKTTVLGEKAATFDDYLQQSGAAGNVGEGVRVLETKADTTPFELVYDPDNADANAEGYVQMPNVDLVQEYVDMISASRSYEANITVMNATKGMALKALEIGK